MEAKDVGSGKSGDRVLNNIILAIGLVFAAVTGYLVYERLQEADARLAPMSYLTFSEDSGDEVLYAGEEVTGAILGSISLPNGYDVFGLGARVIEDTQVNRDWLEGKRLNTTIPRGRVLTYDLFENLQADRLDQVVTKGYRAMSVSVSNAASLDHRILPGNRIDILGVLDDVNNPEAIPVLEDVRVIAVGKALSYEDYKAGRSNYSTITIEVTPEQGLKLTSDRRRVSGEFIVLLRNQCDTAAPSEVCG